MSKLMIVTGACGGIGRELVKRIVLEEGLRCCAFVRDAEKLCKVVGSDCFQKTIPIVHDFEAVSDQWKKDVESLLSPEVREVTLILTACLIGPISKVSDLPSEEIQRNIMTDVMSQVLLVQRLTACCKGKSLPLKIVQLDSGAAYRPICGWSLYCAAKAYMSMFLKTLHAEKEAQVVLYDPGVVDTDMQRQIRTSTQENFPDVELFRKYHMDGKLKNPAAVAREIYERYIIDWPSEGEGWNS